MYNSELTKPGQYFMFHNLVTALTLENEINKGAQGTVYQAFLSDGTPVAVKQCKNISQNEISVIELLNRYPPKRVVRILVHVENQIIMEQCEKDIYKTELLSLQNAIYQIALGIQELHKLNIVHRDIKPENILFRRGIFKICDFGVSHIGRSKNRISGTGNYMPPELIISQSDSKADYGFEVDIWAFGCLIYEISEQKILFPGNTETKIINQLKAYIDNPPKLHEKINNGKIPQFLQKTIIKMLSINPKERPTIDEIIDVFDNRSSQKQ